MKHVSDEFREILNEQIRPATRLYFEVGIDEYAPAEADPDSDLGFDTTVAPVTNSGNCDNQRFYAVIGDYVGVDDPNRICAPGDPATPPPYSVPYGITPFTNANTEVLIGDNTEYYYNFVGFPYGGTLKFLGQHTPTEVRVQRYDSESLIPMWYDESVIYVGQGDTEVDFNITPGTAGQFRRFYVKSSSAGRFQLSWVKRKDTNSASIVFEDGIISNVNISQELDLTSQTLPDYSMTVECLDVDEIYKPDTAYWDNQFKEGSICKLKVGYEINGSIEYVPMFYGKLTKAPTYSEGKLTFDVAVDFNLRWEAEFLSVPNKTLNTGDIVDSILFVDYIGDYNLFDSYDVFHGEDDERGSECNYYGTINANEARQLIANALGCYITAGNNTVDLHNSNDIQYRTYEDYITRWEQIQATLESQPKVGKISVTRNENLLSTNSVQRTIASRFYVHADETVEVTYNIPFWEVGKFVVNDYQRSVPDAVVTAVYNYTGGEEVKANGTVDIVIAFWADRNTFLQPKITFYGVDNNKYQETEYLTSAGKGEEYTNDNDLITNGYTADKAKRVAHLINDTSSHYEVDVVQDYRYELGDVVRLETETNVFKTCVVTGLNFVFPGSSGHIACRKIFSLEDCPQAIIDPDGLSVSSTTYDDQDIVIVVREASESGVVVATQIAEGSEKRLFILGATLLDGEIEGIPLDYQLNGYLTDLNKHDWYFYSVALKKNAVVDTTAPVITLPDYDYQHGATLDACGMVNLLKIVYEAQGMEAPVDYTCQVTIINEGE